MGTYELEGAVSLYLFNSELVERDLRWLQEIQSELNLALASELARFRGAH